MDILQIILAVVIIILAVLSMGSARPWRGTLRTLLADLLLALFLYCRGQLLLSQGLMLFAVFFTAAVLVVAIRSDRARMRPVPFKTYGGAAGVVALGGLLWFIGSRGTGLEELPVSPVEAQSLTAIFWQFWPQSLWFLLALSVLLALTMVAATIIGTKGE